MNSKGEAIYVSNNERIQQKNRFYKLVGKGGGIFGMTTAGILISMFKSDIWAVAQLTIAFIFFLFVFIYSFSPDIIRVYENGITLPYRSLKNMILRREEFIPYTKIEKIYMNSHPSLAYFAVKLKGEKRAIPIERLYIADEKMFFGLLEEKISVEKEKYWAVGEGEVEYPRRRKWVNVR